MIAPIKKRFGSAWLSTNRRMGPTTFIINPANCPPTVLQDYKEVRSTGSPVITDAIDP